MKAPSPQASAQAGLRFMRTASHGTPNAAYKGLKNAGLSAPELQVAPDFPVVGQRWAKHSIGGNSAAARWERHTLASLGLGERSTLESNGPFGDSSPKRRSRISRLRKVKGDSLKPEEILDMRFVHPNSDRGSQVSGSQVSRDQVNESQASGEVPVTGESRRRVNEPQITQSHSQPRDSQTAGQTAGIAQAREAQLNDPGRQKSKRVLRPRKALITLTPNAVGNLRRLLDQPEPQLIRIGVQNRGCSGLTYQLDYVTNPGKYDEVVEQDGVKVLIDSKALFSIVGSEMDWVDDKLSQKFIFRNPNSKGTCGCGESFMV